MAGGTALTRPIWGGDGAGYDLPPVSRGDPAITSPRSFGAIVSPLSRQTIAPIAKTGAPIRLQKPVSSGTLGESERLTTGSAIQRDGASVVPRRSASLDREP